MTPKVVDKEAKKLEIMQAALEVFSQKGVANTKMIDIAKAAAIGKGTIYEYFSSKEDIFATGFQHFFAGVERDIQSALQQSNHPEEQLKNLIRTSLHVFLENHGDFAAIMMDFWAEGIRTKDTKINEAINLKETYREFRKMIVFILENGMEQGVFRKIDAPSFASVLIAAIDGLMLQWVLEPEIFNIKQIADSLCDGILNGIRK